MFTDDEMCALHERVRDRMVLARWLKSYSRRGHQFDSVWTVTGIERAQRLREISQIMFNAGRVDERVPMAFDKLAHGESLGVGVAYVGEIGPKDTAFWRTAMAELGGRLPADELLVLIHIVAGCR